MTDKVDKYNQSKIVLWRQQSRDKILGLFKRNLFQIADCVSVSIFCPFVDHHWLVLENLPFKKTCDESAVWVGILCSAAGYSLPPPRFMKKLISSFLQKSSVLFIGWSFRNWKIAAYLQLAKVWNIRTRVWQNLVFYQFSQPPYDVMENESLAFVRGLKFELTDSLKSNATTYLLIFDNSKTFFDLATALRHRSLSTTYIKHNLFHQSKLERDVELENTHIVLFKSPLDVVQVTTLGAQLDLASELVDWCRDATSVPLAFCWLICRLGQTVDYVIVQTPDPFPQNFKSRTGWNSRKLWTMNTQNLSTLQMFHWFSHKFKNLSLQSRPKEFIRFLCECIKNLLEGNLQSIKRHHSAKFQSEVRLLSLKRTTWKQRRDILASEENLQLIKVITPPVINHLSCYGAVCPRSCFYVQKKFVYPVSYKAWTSKVSTFKKSHVPNWITYEGEKQKLFSKADSLVDKVLSCPRIKLSYSQPVIWMVWNLEPRSILSDFPHLLLRKTQTFQTFTLLYFTLLYLTPLVNIRLWLWIRMPKLKREEAGSLSKSECQKLQRLYTQNGAAYGSVRNLVKAINLSVSKVRQFLHSKPSVTKFTLTTHKFKRMKTFARFKNEVCCMDLAYVDRVAKDNNGVKYILVRQDLFNRTVDAKGMKTKDSKKTVPAFLTGITKMNLPKKMG